MVDSLGYHVVVLQEAHAERLAGLDPSRWHWVLENQQFVGARFGQGGNVRIDVRQTCETKWRVRYLFATVHFDPPRAGQKSLGILSVHLSNIVAKKPVAGPGCFAETIDAALAVGTVDLVCGDLNMAMYQRPGDMDQQQPLQWHETTLNILEERGFIPVADYGSECVFAAVHERHVHALKVAGSCWASREEGLSTEDAEAFRMDFLTTVGAKKTSKDVHWPLTVSLRAPYAEGQRASGFRQRTKAADDRRREKKAARWQPKATVASTTAAPAAPAAPARDPSASAAPAAADYVSGSRRWGSWRWTSSGWADSDSQGPSTLAAPAAPSIDPAASAAPAAAEYGGVSRGWSSWKRSSAWWADNDSWDPSTLAAPAAPAPYPAASAASAAAEYSWDSRNWSSWKSSGSAGW